MSFSKLLAKTYGLPEDYAILIEATWHRDTPTQEELKEVPYYSHDLPEGIHEFVITSRARRAINDGVNLQEVFDKVSNLEMSPNQQVMMAINKMLETYEFKYGSSNENKKYFLKMGKRGLMILKHAAIYQRQILKHEYNGILPRKLPEIIEQVNLVNQKAGK